MTRKEIDKFLANTKVYVNGKSKEIQEKLFSLGYRWSDGCAEVKYTKGPFLYIDNDHDISYGDDMEYFSDNENREITSEEILSIEIIEPDYRPFQSKEECWQEMLKHEPFGWFKHKDLQIYESYCSVDNHNIATAPFKDMYEYYTFADGTPFGIKEE